MIVRYGILIIVLLISNRISPISSSPSRPISNYLHMVCQFLKLPDICRNGYKSNFLKFDFAFGLNLAEECGYQNDTISDAYFVGDTKQIFLYSVFDFRLKPAERLETVDSPNGERLFSTLIPLSDTISMFNNKNVPNIFVFLPVTSGFTAENLSLTVKFDGFEKRDLQEHQTARVALEDRDELTEECTRFNESLPLDEIFADRLNRTVLRSGINRPSNKQIDLKDGNFHAHLQMPVAIRKTLMSDAFIADQNGLNRSLFLSMQFAFDGGFDSADQRTAFNENITALQGTIVLIHCSRIRSRNFITYACETITDYDKSLECFCDYFKPTAYFRYDRFVLIATVAIAGVFLVRTAKVPLDYLRKVLLSKRTMQDRTLYILCSSRTALFGYILKFEIGCASPSFDYETTCIDFELQGPDGQRMTLGRIPSKMLFKERINQIEFKLKRLTQLNRGMLDSVLIKHTCSNPNAKIFLYDLILSEIGDPKTMFRFSVNDYIRSYRQRYVLTVNTFANLSSCEKDSSKESRLRRAESSMFGLNQIKSCELFPSKRIHLQNFPNLNDFEVNLSLFFALLCSLRVNIWLIEHRLCIRRNLLCYFNHFKISFILTSAIYLLTFAVYRLLKHRQMRCIYLKQSSVWRYAVSFFHLLVLAVSLCVLANIYTTKITLYIADFYALLFSIMFTFPLLIALLDLINVFIESTTFKTSLNFKSFRSTRSSDRMKPEKTGRSGVMDSFINYKSAEFRPSVDYSTETNEESEYSSAKLPSSAELDDYYLEMKNLKSSRKSSGSDNSIKSVRSFSINPTDVPAKSE